MIVSVFEDKGLEYYVRKYWLLKREKEFSLILMKLFESVGEVRKVENISDLGSRLEEGVFSLFRRLFGIRR